MASSRSAEFIHGVTDHNHAGMDIKSPTGLTQHLLEHHGVSSVGDEALFELQDNHQSAHGMS